MNIGQAAKASGLSERMIRYHEKHGLIPAPARSDGGYRSYSDDDVRRMRTIALAQDVGFPTSAIVQLVAMMDKAASDPVQAGAEAEAMAELDRKTDALVELRGRIRSMVDKARSRLPDAAADIDWGPPLPAGRPGEVQIITIRGGGDAEHPRRSTTIVKRHHQRDRALTPAD